MVMKDIIFHSLFLVVVIVVVEVVVVDAVNEVVTVEVFSFVSLLPLTVIVVIVFPSGDTTVLDCENSFLFIFSLLFYYFETYCI